MTKASDTSTVFSVDELVGEPKSVFSFSYKNQTHYVFGSQDLKEIYQLRLLEAEVEFSELNETVYPQIEKSEKELEIVTDEILTLTAEDKTVPTSLLLKQRSLDQKLTLLKTKMISPARRSIEAMAQLEPDTLAGLPVSVTSALYGQIITALTTKDSTEVNSSEEAKADEKKSQQKNLKAA